MTIDVTTKNLFDGLETQRRAAREKDAQSKKQGKDSRPGLINSVAVSFYHENAGVDEEIGTGLVPYLNIALSRISGLTEPLEVISSKIVEYLKTEHKRVFIDSVPPDKYSGESELQVLYEKASEPLVELGRLALEGKLNEYHKLNQWARGNFNGGSAAAKVQGIAEGKGEAYRPGRTRPDPLAMS